MKIRENEETHMFRSVTEANGTIESGNLLGPLLYKTDWSSVLPTSSIGTEPNSILLRWAKSASRQTKSLSQISRLHLFTIAVQTRIKNDVRGTWVALSTLF